MKILVTGGAGYIGSITVKELLKKGYEVVVYDNLVYGHKEAVSCPLIIGDLLDNEFLNKSLENENFDAVIHFAALALSGESMRNPSVYFQNNIQGGLNLLELMRKKNVGSIVFSSTCAIYGTPDKFPVDETSEKKPESVYGESKLMFEKVLYWYDKIYNIKHINLRYFNAAGASLDATLGESHKPETHIIPVAISVALGKSTQFELYGNDYDTPDGTCIRDYIHVEDLATAHILALDRLAKTRQSDSFNLGTGKGYSNKEIIEMVKKISGVDFLVVVKERRFGDPPIIYANNQKVIQELEFNYRNSDLETIVKSAWEWHKNSKY